MNLHPYFKAKLPVVTVLFQKHKIKTAYAFGSVLTNSFSEDSDVDLLISFIDGLDPVEKGELMWSLEFALEDALHRPVDLLQESTPRNPYFVKEINSTKMLIYGK